MDMKNWRPVAALTMAAMLLAGCTAREAMSPEEIYREPVVLEETALKEEAVALAAAPAPAVHDLLLPEHPGRRVKRVSEAEVDYSNADDGYVMVCYTAQSDRRLKAKVFGPVTPGGYQYNLTQGEWTTFPLSDGSGKYEVKVYEQNPATGKYAVKLTAAFTAQLTDEFAPFLRPNQYVDYTDAADTLAKAEELTAGAEDNLTKVEKVYDFVVDHLTYDTQLAQTVKSGYLPALDKVLASGKGICFDYAALMTAMLRSQEVPCKLVVGYVGTADPAYHAWISVWTQEQGWVDGAIYFDGTAWQRMDPTFASSGKGSEAIMQYIGDGSNYSARYLY